VQKTVGAAIVSFGEFNYEQETVDYALLDGLQVYPEYRRQGIANGLAKWRIEYTRKKLGNHCTIFAMIQLDNKPSIANSRKWCDYFSKRINFGVFKARTSPPKIQTNMNIDVADKSDYDEIAEKLNNYYKDYNFYTQHSSQYLSDWLNKRLNGDHVNFYLVAKNKNGDIVAGFGISVEAKLRYRKVFYMPPWMTAANKLIKLVPLSGELHEIKIDKFWYSDVHKDAASDLWEYVKWEWREHGNVFVLAYDKMNPISDVVKLHFYMPQGKVMFVVKSSVSMQKNRFVYPVY